MKGIIADVWFEDDKLVQLYDFDAKYSMVWMNQIRTVSFCSLSKSLNKFKKKFQSGSSIDFFNFSEILANNFTLSFTGNGLLAADTHACTNSLSSSDILTFTFFFFVAKQHSKNQQQWRPFICCICWCVAVEWIRFSLISLIRTPTLVARVSHRIPHCVPQIAQACFYLTAKWKPRKSNPQRRFQRLREVENFSNWNSNWPKWLHMNQNRMVFLGFSLSLERDFTTVDNAYLHLELTNVCYLCDESCQIYTYILSQRVHQGEFPKKKTGNCP